MHIGVQLRRGARRLIRRVADGDEKRYRSPQEIALRNAADSLGVALGEDYLADLDLGDLAIEPSRLDDPSRVDAFREELLTYIQGLANQRRRRRRARTLKVGIAVGSIAIAIVLIGKVGGSGPTEFVRDKRSSLPRSVGTGIGIPQNGIGVVTTMPAVGGGDLVHSGYRDLRENVCFRTAQVLRGLTRNETRGTCIQPRDLARAINRRPSFFTGTSGARGYVLVGGYGRSDLSRIVADDSRVRIESAITPAWYPGGSAPDGFAVKAFLARIWLGRSVRFKSIHHLVADPRTLALTAVFTNGERSSVADFFEALHGTPRAVRVTAAMRKPVKYVDCVVLFPGEKLPPGKTRC